VFLTTHMSKADCINKRRPQMLVLHVGRNYYTVLYRNATDYTTVYHLTLLLKKYSSEKFSQIRDRTTNISSSCSVLQSDCSIRIALEKRRFLFSDFFKGLLPLGWAVTFAEVGGLGGGGARLGGGVKRGKKIGFFSGGPFFWGGGGGGGGGGGPLLSGFNKKVKT